MTEFFRHCPGCGRRFHIKLESKNLLASERALRPTTEVVTGAIRGAAGGGLGDTPPIFLAHEGKPIVVDVEEFRYSYKCAHCGHEWTEKHTERRREH